MQNSSPHTLQSITTYQKLRGACFGFTLPHFKDNPTNATGRGDRCGVIFLSFLRKVHQHKSFTSVLKVIRSVPDRARLCHSPSAGPRRRGILRALDALMKR